MSSQPYLASDDSAFLREALKPYHGETCLEIGAGNAGNLVDVAGRFRTVVGTDLVRPSMADWKRHNVNFVMADGSSCLRESTFDLVAFNPPYLAEKVTGDRAVEGGEELEVPRSFLKDAFRVVKQGGKVVMLLNQDADVERLEALCTRNGFGLRRLATRHLFFEELSVYEAFGPPEA
jgi:release factor glutamine methyltransferase